MNCPLHINIDECTLAELIKGCQRCSCGGTLFYVIPGIHFYDFICQKVGCKESFRIMVKMEVK